MTEILIITAFNLIIYFPVLKYNLIVDDTNYYQYMKKCKGDWKHIKGFKSFIDWLVRRIYGVGTFSLNLQIEHLATTLLHTLASVLVYIAFGSNHISFCAALLYSCNPINNQTAIWLNGRRYLFNIIFTLFCLITPFAFILYPLSVYSQVTTIFTPILLLNTLKLEPISILLIIFLISGVLFLIRKVIIKKIKSRIARIKDTDRLEFKPKRLIITVKHYGHYFYKMIIPGICAIVYPKLHYWGVTEKGNKDAYAFNKDFYIGISALLISVIFPIMFPQFAIYSIFMSLSILQWCALIAVTQELADRYTNIANIFMMFFVSYLVNTYVPQYSSQIIIGLIVYYVCMLFYVMPMYANMLMFWEYQRFNFPHIPSPRKFEINWLINKGNMTKAWLLTREGLSYSPNEFIFLYHAAVCHRAIGDFKAAEQFALKAKENYYVDQEKEQEASINKFLDTIKPYLNNTQPQVVPSRQQRRAEDRKKK